MSRRKRRESSLVRSNHEKLGHAVTRAIDLLPVIPALTNYRDDRYAQDWRAALIRFYWHKGPRLGRYLLAL